MYTRNLLTALKNNLQIMKKCKESIANLPVDDDAQPSGRKRKRVTSLDSQAYIETTPTTK